MRSCVMSRMINVDPSKVNEYRIFSVITFWWTNQTFSNCHIMSETSRENFIRDSIFPSKRRFQTCARISGLSRNSRSNKSLKVGSKFNENCFIRWPISSKISGLESVLKNCLLTLASLKSSLMVKSSPREIESVGIRNISAFAGAQKGKTRITAEGRGSLRLFSPRAQGKVASMRSKKNGIALTLFWTFVGIVSSQRSLRLIIGFLGKYQSSNLPDPKKLRNKLRSHFKISIRR